MVEAVDEEDPRMLNEAIQVLRDEADEGNAHAQSTLGSLHWMACGVPHSDAKAFLYHEFAKEGGNAQSKMALAYRYYRNQVLGLLLIWINASLLGCNLSVVGRL
jgi:SEL1 protein